MKNYVGYWVLSHALAVLMLFAALALMNSGCTKKATKIEMAPDVPAKAVEQTAAVKSEYEPQRFAPAVEQAKTVNVYFDFDSDALKTQEAMKLDYLLGGAGIIRLIGHTCTIGTKAYNVGLGLARAERVREYLGRGEINSYGEEMCRAACESVDEAECAECRRVEVVLQ